MQHNREQARADHIADAAAGSADAKPRALKSDYTRSFHPYAPEDIISSAVQAASERRCAFTFIRILQLSASMILFQFFYAQLDEEARFAA